MGSTSYLPKSKSSAYKSKSGSSGGSDKEMNGKLRRPKIRRPTKLNEYGLKRIPDYTELAYKEAVSKLRYFLSGNYAPSVRSYGGSASIKNLDESDGDIDKKYNMTPSYTPLEYTKPRPRLTAKYTTLYADSLNNTYTPHHNVTAAPPPAVPAADVTGGTNPDVINFIQKQEEYIEQLERESQYCRDELNNLLGKVKEVISENEHLHEAQKNKLISRMFHSYNAGSETDELEDFGDSTGLDSDNKESATRARRVAKSRPTKLEGPNIVFESRIAELEAQLTQSRIDLKKLQEENNENKRKLASGLVDSTCLDGFKRQIDNLQRDKSSLESQISKLKLSLEQREGDDGKYRRGSDVVEHQLREERNNLETELRRLKDDLAKERSKLREVAGEGARRAIQERSAAEQRYNAHFDELQHDLAAQYDNVSKLQLDLERQRREENDLKRELSMKNSAIEELKMELKNKTSSLQADLAQAHAEKASLEEELASARLAIERHQRQAKHETNRLNSEIQSLRQRLDRADADLVHSRRENLRLSEQISTLEKELNMKNLTPISPEKKKEKELSTMLESMDNKHAKTVAELESMIQSQNSLMEKLTGECRLLTDKLDDANRRHKAERTQLLCRNIELMRKLRNLWSSHKKYCTTTIAPLRSYTPLSGYPNSRTSYDLDRTYYTSTPYTYRNRFRRSESSNNSRDEVGELTRTLSDLSIDKFGDSDEDPLKCDHVCAGVCSREELGTLQRQVESLGRSMQPTHATAPSSYQAPPTHSSPANRNVPRPTSAARSDNTRVDTAGYAQPGDRQTVADIRPDGGNHHPASRPMSRQSSKQSVLHHEVVPPTTASANLSEYREETNAVVDTPPDTAEYRDSAIEKAEVEPNQDYYGEGNVNNYDPNFEQPQITDIPQYEQTHEPDNVQYEQSHEADNVQYEQTPVENPEYQSDYGQQQYEQPQEPYTEGQYENYEQYPQQQYTDPNAQYEGQYENYAPDATYQEDQSYNENPQVTQEMAPEYQPQLDTIVQPVTETQPDLTENKRSNSPNEKKTSQS